MQKNIVNMQTHGDLNNSLLNDEWVKEEIKKDMKISLELTENHSTIQQNF